MVARRKEAGKGGGWQRQQQQQHSYAGRQWAQRQAVEIQIGYGVGARWTTEKDAERRPSVNE